MQKHTWPCDLLFETEVKTSWTKQTLQPKFSTNYNGIIAIALIKSAFCRRRDGGRVGSLYFWSLMVQKEIKNNQKPLPDKSIPTTGMFLKCQKRLSNAKQQFTPLLQVFTLHFGFITFLCSLLFF